MLKRGQVSHVRAERDLMVTANSRYLQETSFAQLSAFFFDAQSLYLMMEYLPGGDMMTLLMKHDVLTEQQARFYIAETALAIDSIHSLGYIHRDLKPDNVLFDAQGHIKLSDFGLSAPYHTSSVPQPFQPSGSSSPGAAPSPPVGNDGTSTTYRIATWKRTRKNLFSTAGTPDYIAPEVVLQTGYGAECDWWSLGIILFEMLVGYPPFASETTQETYYKIIHWKQTLHFPSDIRLSAEAIDLIEKLLAPGEKRIGMSGLRQHPFFARLTWETLLETQPPFVPTVTSPTDTSNFDDFGEPTESDEDGEEGLDDDTPEQDPSVPVGSPAYSSPMMKDIHRGIKKKHAQPEPDDRMFAGYSYRRFPSTRRGSPMK
eukprot:TRINITY_DN755_c0_g1_i1.p1 TRINITY_DN755_c0_g1~~TRINITY_DN755_c0_g1_i1.p1  ORF type:complete len:372 (-),score=89.18 TRINITY_DN755_c0_g1_i1:30-1145(-)